MKTQYFTATSVDGFIADDKNSLDWLFQFGGGPVILGSGAPLLPRRIATPPLKLVSAETIEAGFLRLHYEVQKATK